MVGFSRLVLISLATLVLSMAASSGANAAENPRVEKVLQSRDACSVPLSELTRRLNAARTPAEKRSAEAESKVWGCYDPQPGHPTTAEKVAYIKRISGYATKAEAKYGVPAAVITAMALVESGYGFTRTAQYAHNIFGWKISERSSSSRYVLACQDTTGEIGDKDENRCYVAFPSEEAAVDRVASRLASGFHPNYAKADLRYRRETAANVPAIVRTQNWAAGIAKPYNWCPTKYARTLCRLMRNPVSGSNSLDPTSNLYQLSARPGEEISLSSFPASERSCNAIVVPTGDNPTCSD